MRPRSIRRLRAPACALVALALLAALAPAPAGASEQLVPYIVGGQQSTISEFPWQVFVVGEIEPTLSVSCGGSILDATHILTAAHCVDHEGTTTTYPADIFEVLAGASEVLGFLETGKAPAGAQRRAVASIRTHPYYAVLPETRDDVAVLTLAAPLELSGAANAQPIGIVAAGPLPAPGTPLSISGYGKQSGAESATPDGRLYSTTLTAISSDACRTADPVNSAVLLCAQSASASTCQGDSGGPLTEGAPAVEVGIVDFGARECPVGSPDVFTNLAAPEVRAFIEGSETPPVAARPAVAPTLTSVGATPVDYSPMTCEPGSWSGSPSFSYTFQLEGPSQTVLQSGPGASYLPQSNVVGSAIVCIVQAANAGGVSTLRSGTSPPVANDTSPPNSTISGPAHCHLQACVLTIRASDPNEVALSLRASASYAVVTACPKRRRGTGRHVVCHRNRSVAMSIAATAAGVYRASVSGLPYGEPIRFSVRASDAAELAQEVPAALTTTLRRPAPKHRRH